MKQELSLRTKIEGGHISWDGQEITGVRANNNNPNLLDLLASNEYREVQAFYTLSIRDPSDVQAAQNFLNIDSLGVAAYIKDLWNEAAIKLKSGPDCWSSQVSTISATILKFPGFG